MTGWLNQYPHVPAAPTNYAVGREGYRPLWFVIHCTDTEYADNYPVNLGAYWSHNNTSVSVHFCVSDTLTYQYVNCDDTAYQVRNPGNLRGIGVELVGRSAWTRNQWLAHKPMLRRAAKLAAEVTLAYGLKTTLERLGLIALRSRLSGLTCHKDCSDAFAGTHTDPGAPGFPWDFFGVELRNALAGVDEERARLAASKTPPPPTPTLEGLMTVTDAQFKNLADKVDRLDDIIAGKGSGYADSNLAKQLGYVVAKIGELGVKVDAALKAKP